MLYIGTRAAQLALYHSEGFCFKAQYSSLSFAFDLIGKKKKRRMNVTFFHSGQFLFWWKEGLYRFYVRQQNCISYFLNVLLLLHFGMVHLFYKDEFVYFHLLRIIWGCINQGRCVSGVKHGKLHVMWDVGGVLGYLKFQFEMFKWSNVSNHLGFVLY